ncbi:hypothetical protein GCM10023069_61460 [Shinella granuli]
MAGFYSARSSIMPPLPWPTFAPPLSEPEDDVTGNTVRALLEGFGPRHHLIARFNAVLRRRGRLIEV